MNDYTPLSQPVFLQERTFTSTSFPESGDGHSDEDDVYARNAHVRMNPKSIGRLILPGNMTERIDLRKKEKKLINADREFGHFWMLKDLRETDGKPVLANTSLIPLESAKLFPPLRDLATLSGNTVHLPDCLIRDADAAKSCTLVLISYKDYGFQLLPSWAEPFSSAFLNHPHASILRIAVTEGFFTGILKPMIMYSTRNNTPADQHDSFLTYFGNTEDWRDSLRMYNMMTGYAVLVDGFGRVRWMGSGKAASEEIDILLDCGSRLLKGHDLDISDERDEMRSMGRKGKKLPK